MSAAVARVIIVQRRLAHYRVAFFNLLRSELSRRGIGLQLIHGQPSACEMAKGDAGELSWARKVTNQYFTVGNSCLCWVPLSVSLQKSDLVVLTQENSLLSNYPLLLRGRLRGVRVAYWGHGANLQLNRPDAARERFKRWTTRQVDWWFTYSSVSAELVRKAGFPEDRITVLNNAIDTTELSGHCESIRDEDRRQLKEALTLTDGATAVFVGSLYEGKRIDFLLSAARAIQSAIPAFKLIVLGDGPQRELVRKACSENAWLHWAGMRTGREKALYISLAEVMLNPGLVGLGLLDSFACRVPMITTSYCGHGPEIAYLTSGVNGLMTDDDLAAFVEATVGLLRNEAALQVLKAGCSQSAREYTIENMACRFADGVSRCRTAGPY